MARTINKNLQPKNKNARPTNEVYGGAGLTDPTHPKPKKEKRRTSGQETGHEGGQTNSGQGGLVPKYPTSRPKSRKNIPSCFWCVAKQKAISGHWINECPQLTALNKKELVQLLPYVCLGCLRRKKGNSAHKCPA